MVQNFKQKLILSVSVSFGIIIAFTIGLAFLGTEISGKSDTVFNNRTQLNSSLANISELSRLKTVYQEVNPLVGKLNSALPSRDEILLLQRRFSDLASRHSLSLNFSFGAERTLAEDLIAISFDINTRGTYTNTVRFIEELESTYKLLNIISVDITGQGEAYIAKLLGEILFNDR
ncbi:MAG: type 4a pilus biogenesis protein PilO [Candidatus Colwellbacteria bacterium]|nr:type 4a pilus biogenesis protein PilO [Candidatus Colwellbacteria bacterium]